jgi:uncharacterized protein
MSPPAGFAAFEKGKYLSLETFKKSGQGVRTPIWFAADPSSSLASGSAKLFVYTVDNTGKVKRIRNNTHIRIAPCNARGKVLGDWVEAQAEILAGQEAARGMQLLDKKYWPVKQIMGLFARFSSQARVVIAIKPA